MATTIAVLSQKGGTGKTTTVRTLADVLTRAGLDVLESASRASHHGAAVLSSLDPLAAQLPLGR